MNRQATTPTGWRSGALLLAFLMACSEADAPVRSVAPTAPRATLVLEPPRLGLGEIALLELAVVTPPGHAVRPFVPPSELEGFWILDAEAGPVTREGSRWLHRTRLRIRPRAVGRLLWPAGTVDVEAPDGSVAPLPFEGLEIEVSSSLPDAPDRLVPYGARELPEAGAQAPPLAAAVLGAALALAVVGLVGLARRRARFARSADAASALPPPEPPWIAARAELAAARDEADAFTAANAASVALCRYMAARFGADSIARTTEELEEATPPFGVTSRWPTFLSVLRGLDALRFRPEADPAIRTAVAARVLALVDEALAFVEETIPPEARK